MAPGTTSTDSQFEFMAASKKAESAAAEMDRVRKLVIERSIKKAEQARADLELELQFLRSRELSDVEKESTQMMQTICERVSTALDTLSGSAKTAAEVCSHWIGDAELQRRVESQVADLNKILPRRMAFAEIRSAVISMVGQAPAALQGIKREMQDVIGQVEAASANRPKRMEALRHAARA